MIKIEITIDDGNIENVVRSLKVDGAVKQMKLTDIPDKPTPPATVEAKKVEVIPPFKLPVRRPGQNDSGLKQMQNKAVREYYEAHGSPPPGYVKYEVKNGFRLMKAETLEKVKCPFCRDMVMRWNFSTHKKNCASKLGTVTHYEPKEKPLVSVFEGTVDRSVKTYPDNAAALRDS